jgi:aminoglycoside phosphotransferase (APT) family kinase protein
MEHKLEIEILKGGVSNRVVRVAKPNGEAWVVKQALPKLRVAVDWYSSPTRIHREALGLKWLRELGVAVPRLQFEDGERYLLAMEAIPEPHENWKSVLLSGRIDLMHVRSFAEMLVTIHVDSFRRRTELEPMFRDTSFFESLRIEPYYSYTAGQVPSASAFIAHVIAGTRANRVCLVHGDYSPKNILIREGSLILLDHEVIHWGDPSFDLGFSMTHLLSKANHAEAKREDFRLAVSTFWDVYWKAVARQPWVDALEQRAVGSTLACLLARVAGRSQLEYLTDSERRRQLVRVVRLMAAPPATVRELITGFIDSLSTDEA